MDKLNSDELLLIMLSMKKQYEEQYKILENKYNSLSTYCNEEDNGHNTINLLDSGICNCCDKIIYKVLEDNPHDLGCINSNYYNCSGCNKIICDSCIDDENMCSIEYMLNPLPNKFWCINCNNFNIKMKTIK
tara:strand:+ start:43 stop:438 length:396 start_codon:yes stop_codon:yes gene_type:complete